MRDERRRRGPAARARGRRHPPWRDAPCPSSRRSPTWSRWPSSRSTTACRSPATSCSSGCCSAWPPSASRPGAAGADAAGVAAAARAAGRLRLPARRRSVPARRRTSRRSSTSTAGSAAARCRPSGCSTASTTRATLHWYDYAIWVIYMTHFFVDLARRGGAVEGRPRSLPPLRLARGPGDADRVPDLLAVPGAAAVAGRRSWGDRPGRPDRARRLGPARRAGRAQTCGSRRRPGQPRRGDAVAARLLPVHAAAVLLARRLVVRIRWPLHAGDGLRAGLRRRALRDRRPRRLGPDGHRVRDRDRRPACVAGRPPATAAARRGAREPMATRR